MIIQTIKDTPKLKTFHSSRGHSPFIVDYSFLSPGGPFPSYCGLFVSLTWGPIPQLLWIVRFSHLGAPFPSCCGLFASLTWGPHSPVIVDCSLLSPGGPIPQLLWIVRFSHLGAPFPSYCGLFASLTWGPHSPVIVDCSLLSPGGPALL